PDVEGDAVRFVALPDGTILVEEGPEGSLEPLAAAVEQALRAPYRAQGVRQSESLWAVQARRIEVLELPGAPEGDALDLTRADYITSLEPEFEKLSDEELAGKTVEFRERLERGETLDDVLFEAYAAVREAFKRSMDVRLFDVQLMGGIVLHEGDIAEMKTGEGKTFVAVQPLYLNALAGRGVHLVTVNDYLAQRDQEWTQPVFEALGMRTAYIENMMPFQPRR